MANTFVSMNSPRRDNHDLGKKWVVCVKGNAKGFEISVLRAFNVLGKESYGWFGKNKIMIASCADHQGPVSRQVFTDLRKLAQAEADRMNAAD